MKIGIAFDLAPAASSAPHDGPDDRFEEFDKPETVEAIAAVIRAEGHEVSLLGDGRDFLARVLDDPPDFVFNIAEGEGIGRCREARVPAVLEMLGIPYSGSDPLTLAASLDKSMARTLVAGGGDVASEAASGRRSPVAVPIGSAFPAALARHPDYARQCVREVMARIGNKTSVHRALILKPAFEGSSKGVRNRCLVDTEDEAAAVLAELAENYDQPILIEEFIAGDEVTVGVVGNTGIRFGLEFFGTMRIVPRQATRRFVYSLEVKRDWINQVSYETPAELAEEAAYRLVEAAERVRSILDLRDLARIDFRVRDGMPYFIEANPLPGLAPGVGDLVIMAEGYGISHAELIRRVLHAALTRVGLR